MAVIKKKKVVVRLLFLFVLRVHHCFFSPEQRFPVLLMHGMRAPSLCRVQKDLFFPSWPSLALPH